MREVVKKEIMKLLDAGIIYSISDSNWVNLIHVVGQRRDKQAYAIYYASHTLDEAHMNYAITEKELLAVIFTIEKFSFLSDRQQSHSVH